MKLKVIFIFKTLKPVHEIMNILKGTVNFNNYIKILNFILIIIN